jgi:hypothetical protein
MKQILYSNWTFMRFLRLGLGLAVFVQAIAANEIGFAIAGILFMAMPLFNIGCCGTAGCTIPSQKEPAANKDITYEEVV